MPRRSPSTLTDSQSSALRRTVDDPLAFGEFYEVHAQQMLVFFVRRVADTEIALELMSETFAIALEKCGQFRGTNSDQEAGWLYAIARSQLSRFWRLGKTERSSLERLGLQSAVLTDPEIERIEDLAGMATLTEELGAAMAELPRDQREAIQLKVVDELDYPAVARQLNVSEQVVRARVSRGLRKLAKRLQPDVVGRGAQ